MQYQPAARKAATTAVGLLLAAGLAVGALPAAAVEAATPAQVLAATPAAKQYRYAQKSGPVYTSKSSSKQAGWIHRGQKLEYRQWDAAHRRDEVKVNGKWVWTSVTNRAAPKAEYRYAQVTGPVYSSASSSTASGTIHRGDKVAYGAWDA